MQAKHSEAEYSLWAYDEHRLGLQPIARRIWAKRGNRPIITNVPRYEWLYLYGFVCPESGQSYWLIMPTVNITVFNLALKQFARDQGLNENKRIAFVLDGAGWHRSEQVEKPVGIDFIFLPAYSPELQPAERLWPLSNEGIANRTFNSLAELEKAQAARCVALNSQSELIIGTTLYSWLVA